MENENKNSLALKRDEVAIGIRSAKLLLEFMEEAVAFNDDFLEALPPEVRLQKGAYFPFHPVRVPTHPPDDKKKQGFTIAEFAELLGVDRGTLRNHLVVIPSGPAPSLPPGKIPCRKIGKTKRIFEQDLFGTPEDKVERNDSFEEEIASTEHESGWRRQIDNLRLGRHLDG